MHNGDAAVPPGTQTLARGLAIVRAVASGTGDLRGIVDATGVGRSTAHRLLQLLAAEGYVQKARDRYVLGPTLIEFGFLALQQNPVPMVARPVLEGLSEKYKDTVHLAINDDNQVLYLDKMLSLRGPETRSRIGYRMPLTRTGIGKALLLDNAEGWEAAYRRDRMGEPVDDSGVAEFLQTMAKYASTGTTMDLEENEPGIRCVAAPIRGGDGRVSAAISITATRPYMPMTRMRALVPVVADAAHSISLRLGYAGR